MPRITAATVTLVNGVPQLSITGKDLNPDPQELPVVQVTGGASSECIASSIRAAGTRHDHFCLIVCLNVCLHDRFLSYADHV